MNKKIVKALEIAKHVNLLEEHNLFMKEKPQPVLGKLKKGDYFMLPPKGRVVYVYDGWNRFAKAYSFYRFDDISTFRHLKNKNTPVVTDIDF